MSTESRAQVANEILSAICRPGTPGERVGRIFAPTFLNKVLPPLPAGIAAHPLVQAITPRKPGSGPPLPEGLNITWPGFFRRAIERARTDPPWKTIPQKGIIEELKREIEVITGVRIGGKHG